MIPLSTRENLKDYYRFIRVCKYCKKEYGSDHYLEGDNQCPICTEKERLRGSILAGTKRTPQWYKDNYTIHHKPTPRGGNVLAGGLREIQKSRGGNRNE